MSTIRLSQPVALRAARVDRDAGIIRNVSILSAGPAEGHGFQVDQLMLKQAHDTMRTKGRTPMHLTHAHAVGLNDPLLSRVGYVDGNTLRLDHGALRGDVHLSRASSNLPGLGDARGFLLDAAEETPESLGLSIVFSGTFENDRDGSRLARIKQLVAVDFVGDPGANPNGLLSKGNTMPETTNTTTAEEAVKLERQRTSDIKALAEKMKLGSEWADKQIAEGVSLQAAKDAAIEAVAEKRKPVPTGSGPSYMGSHEERIGEAISDAIACRLGARRIVKTDTAGNMCLSANGQPELRAPVEAASRFRGMPIFEMARHFLEAAGVATYGMSRAQLTAEAMNREHRVMLSHTTSDFPSLLKDAANKTLRMGYAEKLPTWTEWARRITAPDFKPINRPQIGVFPTPVEVGEAEELTYVTIDESDDAYTLREFKQGFTISWRAMVNDDLGAFDILPKLGASCRRLEDDIAYIVLTGNQVMSEDGKTLFHDDHNNIGEHDGLTVAALGAGVAAIMRQQALGGGVIDLLPDVLLVAPEQFVTAQQLLAAITPDQPSNAVPEVIRQLRVVPSSRIDAGTWYLAAGPSQIDGVEVCFLDGYEVPQLKAEEDFDTDNQKFKVKHVVAARALDWRGVYRGTETEG